MNPSCRYCQGPVNPLVPLRVKSPPAITKAINLLLVRDMQPATYVHVAGDCLCNRCALASTSRRCTLCDNVARVQLVSAAAVSEFMNRAIRNYVYATGDAICKPCYDRDSTPLARPEAQCTGCRIVKPINLTGVDAVTRAMMTIDSLYIYKEGDVLCSACSHIGKAAQMAQCKCCGLVKANVMRSGKVQIIGDVRYPLNTLLCVACKKQNLDQMQECVICQTRKRTTAIRKDLLTGERTIPLGSRCCQTCYTKANANTKRMREEEAGPRKR